MKYAASVLLCAALVAPSLPASAQSVEPPSFIPQLKLPEELDDALRKMMDDLKPTLDETMKMMESFGNMGDPRHYHLPEVLPNGDIIMRRREDAPAYEPPAPDPSTNGEKGIRT
ncbi:MAG: hypothetical protein AAF479_01320 [Pseudomonadota bacterium]